VARGGLHRRRQIDRQARLGEVALPSPVSMMIDASEPLSRNRLSTSMPLMQGSATSSSTTSQSARSVWMRSTIDLGSVAISTS
jgi:hypothetical protein